LRATHLRLHPSGDDSAWDDVVSKHPDGTAFHLSGFLRTASTLLGRRVDLLMAEADGEVVGVVPLLIRAVGPAVAVNYRPPFPYLGPLLPPECSLGAVVAAVRRAVRPRTLVHLGVQSTSPIPVPAGRGWQGDDYESAIVPVGGKDDDELLGQMARTQRNTVLRAAEQGLTAGPATREEIDRLTAWAGATMVRQGLRPRWPAGTHLRLFDALAPTGVAHATAVHRDGDLLAVSLDMLVGGRLIGWEIGISEEGRALGASSLLINAVLRSARDNGAVEVDLLGAPTPGVARYKRSLGAEIRPRSAVSWSSRLLPSPATIRRLSAVRRRISS
jgi:hypothetical protein